MSLVLIVEDEPVLRSSVARGLSRLPNVEIVTAGTVEDALRLIDVAPPALVLSDLDLPDRSGLELLTELEQRRLNVHVVFVSAYLGTFGPQIPRRAHVETLEKPVPMERLRELVTARLRESVASSPGSSEAPFSLDEYIQLACMGRHSLVMTVAGGKGEIEVFEGELWSARDPQGDGPDALLRIVRRCLRDRPKLSCRTLRNPASARSIAAGQGLGLLLDAARMHDEARTPVTVAPPPPDHGVPAPPRGFAREAEAFERLYDEGIDALLHKRYQDALESFLAADSLIPGDSKVVTNITRLRELCHGRKA